MKTTTKATIAIATLLIAGAITGTSFADTTDVTSISVSSGSSTFAGVTTATTDGKHATAPTWEATPGSAGGVQAGDLYIIDTEEYTGDLFVTIYMTNVGDLAKRYTYLNLGATVYEWDDALGNGEGDWESTPIAGVDQNSDLTHYMTLSGGYVSFVLDQDVGGGKYSLGIDGGSFYANPNTSGGSLSPAFFVDVRQA